MHPELAHHLIQVQNAELDRVARRAVVAHADAAFGRGRRLHPRRTLFDRFTQRDRALRDLCSPPAAHAAHAAPGVYC
jgi:hypothetical protein